MIRVLSTNRTYTVCQACKAGRLAIDHSNTLAYFHKRKIPCPKCGAFIDWWEQILWQIQCQVPSLSLAPAGAFDTWLTITMKPGEVATLDLSECGIPASSRILQLGYTPQGKGLFPLELHGNIPLRHIIPHTIHLYGRPTDDPEPETEILVSVLWVPASEEEESWNNMILAFEAFHHRAYESVVIPANVAVESKLNRMLSKTLAAVVSNERVDRFLTDAATYGHQLNVLLPFVASIMGLPELPNHIRGILNRLKRNRNELAHTGKLSKTTTERQAAEYICAAFFSFVYINQLDMGLESRVESVKSAADEAYPR